MEAMDTTGRSGGGRRLIFFGAAAGAAAVLAAAGGAYELMQWLGSSRSASGSLPALPSQPVVTPASFQAKTGVRLTQVAVTGAGGLVDLRFQVLDSSKAAAIHRIPSMLVDERTGVVVNRLLMGHQHKGRMRAGQGYYLIFINPGNLVARGSRVTVQLGSAQVAHIPVA